MIKKYLVLAATLLGMSFVMNSTPLLAEEGQTTAGKALILHGRDEPETLDPGLCTGIVEANLVVNLFEGLMRYDAKDLEPKAGIAESWSLSSDGKTYTFKIRPNAVWSDGTPITAEDFVYSWERVLRPSTAAGYAFQLYYIKNGEAYNQGKITDPKQLGLQAVDARTLKVTLENPTPYFIKLAAFHTLMPVKKDTVTKHGNNSWAFPGKMVNNGPFLLKGWTPQKEIVLVKNPKYWDAANVSLDVVKFLPVPEYETAVKMYEMGQLDSVFELPPLKVEQLKNRPDFVSAPFLNSMYYWFNTKVKPLDDPRVRQALVLAIDRKVITDKVLRRGDIAINSFVPPGIAGYTSPIPNPTLFNPTKAKQLLKEAGYGEGGKPFPVLEILYNTTAEHKTVAEVIQNMWKTNLGIDVKLRNEEWKSYLKSMQSHNFQICRAGWVGDYVDPNTFLDLLYSKNSQNYGQYNSPKYDKFITMASAEQNKTLRARYLASAEEIALTEFPIIPLYTMVKNFLKKPYVQGYYPTMLDVHPLYGASR